MELDICPLFSGSSGNSTYLSFGNTKILIDAGVSCKRVCEALSMLEVRANELSAIVVTHEHIDHIKGIGLLSRKYDIPVYANELTWEAMLGVVGPIADKNMRVFQTGMDFFVKDVCIRPFSISHDAADPVGYSFSAKGKKVSIVTDIGYMPADVIEAVSYSDLLIIEANHDIDMLTAGRYPYHLKRRILSTKGHLSNEACANALVKLYEKNVKRVLLGHMSKENNAAEVAFCTIESILSENGIVEGKDMFIDIALEDKATGLYKIV